MEKEAEHAVLHDWLKKEGGAKGDPAEWIHAIARETHGWPQHIVSYVELALKQLLADKRIMTTEGINTVLKAGRVSRTRYYEQRTRGFYREHIHCLARVFADVPIGGSTSYTMIISSLTQECNREEAEEIFHRAKQKGILDERENSYVIPIPSMQNWLVSKYAHIQI